MTTTKKQLKFDAGILILYEDDSNCFPKDIIRSLLGTYIM